MQNENRRSKEGGSTFTTPSKEALRQPNDIHEPYPDAPDDVDTADVDLAPIARESAKESDEPSVTFEPGPNVVMGHYELIREIPGGGMGRVFVARDMMLGRRVAIKILRRMTESARQRFFNEARVTARCTHENIVVIHEIAHHKGMPFIVLEYLQGRPLNTILREEGLGTWHAVELFIQVCRALEHAHAAGIVHRDLKPGNIFELRTGGVKVLDFGIARFFQSKWLRDDTDGTADVALRSLQPQTSTGALVGTMNYMAPEQWSRRGADSRADLWAAGLTLLETLTGKHPLKPLSESELVCMARQLDEPIEGLAKILEEVPEPLQPILARCLEKNRDNRYPNAAALREALESTLPSTGAAEVSADECPYPGLLAFREQDSARFYGRDQDIQAARARLRQLPLLAVVGPSGVGKSSFVQAGLIPALKASGEPWESRSVRPGHNPLTAMARLIATLESADAEVLEAMLREEPHLAGRLLRGRTARRNSSLIVYVDQFEELYTLGADAEERALFIRAISSIADDPASALRLVLSIRSDLLDRVAETPAFADALMQGALLLRPPSQQGLRDALVKPLEQVGYRFEFDEQVEEMLDDVGADDSVLPLLQFAASVLWERRDREQRCLTRRQYHEMGGLAGALAQHASATYDSLNIGFRRLARILLVRLVTPDGTRAVMELDELMTLGPKEDVGRVVNHLVGARMLLLYPREVDEVLVLELAHEALIEGWPRLARWVAETRDELEMIAQLQNAAQQWDVRGRPEGLVWTGDVAEDALRWRTRNAIPVGATEQAFLEAAARLAARKSRRLNTAIAATMVVLLLLCLGSAVALVRIHSAERKAQQQARVAKQRAVKIQHQLAEIHKKELARRQAAQHARIASRQAHDGRVKLRSTQSNLKMTYGQLVAAFARIKGLHSKAQQARLSAEKEARAAKDASVRERLAAAEARRVGELLKKSLAAEQARVKQLKLKLVRKKMINTLQ